MVIVTILCFVAAYRTTLPITIACAAFMFSIVVLLVSLAPIRIALDAVDRAVIRMKGERFD